MLYSFDDYTLAAEHCELRQAGRLVRLAPRVFNLLAYLVQHRGRIVTNEELKEQLCPKREMAGESSVVNAAAQARKALGDAGQVQRYIQTVHRRGYRFVMPVTARPPGATDLPDAACADTPQPPVMPLLGQADAVSPFAPGPSASPATAMPMLPTVTLPTATTSAPRSAAALETPEGEWRPLTELAHPYSLAMVQFQAACLHHHRRDVPAVQAHAGALLTLATDQGFPLFVGHGTYLQGWVLAMQGEGAAGLAAILAAGQELSRPFGLVLLAEAAGHVGQVKDGLRLLAEALTVLEASGRGDLLAEAYRLQGTLPLHRAVADAVQAETCFQQALGIASRQQAKSWELRTALSLSRLWQQQSKRAEARALLTPIIGWFTEGLDTPDLQEAKTLLEVLA